jgi:hypothetical protein
MDAGSSAVVDFRGEVRDDLASGSAFVWHPNERAPSTKLGSARGTARSAMWAPGGNAGDRTRRYQPRLGRCTDQTTRLAACSYTFSMISSSER